MRLTSGADSNTSFEPARLRRTVIEMAFAGSSAHIACSFSIIELLSILFRNHLHYPDNNPDADGRDFLILSKGHGVMAQYACMRELGWINDDDIRNYFKDGSDLKGLSDSRVRGLEVTSGSLGHGFSVGVGMALGLKLKKKEQKIYAIVGDGEINEGPIWEGAMFAAHHQLNNLMLIVDHNGFQAMGSTSEVMSLGDIGDKFKAFGFEVLLVDGHDEFAIDTAINKLWQTQNGNPKALIAETIKGKGVSFMEADNRWHYTRLNPATYASALAELLTKEEQL